MYDPSCTDEQRASAFVEYKSILGNNQNIDGFVNEQKEQLRLQLSAAKDLQQGFTKVTGMSEVEVRNYLGSEEYERHRLLALKSLGVEDMEKEEQKVKDNQK